MLDQIPTEVTNHSKARTDGVSSSDMLARIGALRFPGHPPQEGNLRGRPEG
jgi:hypothetical protein